MGVFRKRLREMMDEKGMRQADLVAATGIDRSLISSYVTGRYEPKDENLQAIAKVLNCDPMWLMGYDGVEEGDESVFLSKFRELNKEDKRTILTLLNFMNDHERRNNEEYILGRDKRRDACASGQVERVHRRTVPCRKSCRIDCHMWQ